MKNSKKSLYETDFYAWCLTQANLLKNNEYGKLDLENVIEEIESMGKWEKQKLTSALRVIFLHILKYIYQPERRSKSWRDSIGNKRDEAEYIIQENPSLKSAIDDCAKKAYELARREAARETGIFIKAFPETMPFTIDQALNETWLPE